MNNEVKEILDNIKRDVISYGLTVEPKEKVIVSKIIEIICSYYFSKGRISMNEKEKDLIARIDKINEMLNVLCIELNNYNEIDDYEIELNEGVITTCLNEKPERKYRIIVICKNSLESKGE